MRRGRARPEGCGSGDEGFSIVVIVLTLLVTAALSAILFGTFFNSNSGANSSTSVTNAPGVAMATNLQAQQSLSQGLTAVSTASSAEGAGGAVDASSLSAADPSVSFVEGPSSSATTVSVASGGGSVTLADRSSDGTCWLVWRAGPGPTWYGAQTGLSSCTAPVLTVTPTPGPVSSSSIGWQQGSFPSA